MAAVSYRFVASKLPVRELEKDTEACRRCGHVRRIKHGRKSSGYCWDCLRFAVADGWTDLRPGRTKQPTQPTQRGRT